VTATVTAVTVAYGGAAGIDDAVDHLLASAGVELDVVVVDNGTSDGVLDRVRSTDRVQVLDAGENLGYGGAGNLGARRSKAEFLAFVNPDVVVEPDTIARLVAVAGSDDVGIASASVRLREDPSLLNSAGGAIHFLGLGWAEGFREPASTVAADRDATAASGACMVLRRERFAALGGFTPELFLYHEDAELSLRAWMRGWRVRYVADAIALHDYDFGRNPRKLELLERNRLVVVLTCYSRRLLLLVLPALLVYELGMAVLALAQGWGSEKVAGWRWLLQHAGWLREQRRRVQRDRRVSDRDLVDRFAARFTGAQVALPRVLAPADRLLAAYWGLVARWV
jgi:GT2 family glycosyltransferase